MVRKIPEQFFAELAALDGGGSDNGVIFSVSTNGTGYNILKTFSATVSSTNSDGSRPSAGLLFSGHILYGIARLGGSHGYGTVFRLGLPPEIQVADPSFGLRTNRFGFNVIGASNQVVTVEACTDLNIAGWLPLQTNTIAGGPLYFSDPDWMNHASRFYRVRSP